MQDTLKAHSKSLSLIFEKSHEVATELRMAGKELEKLIAETPTGETRNRLTDVNILLQNVLYKNF